MYGELATYWFLKTKADGSKDDDVRWLQRQLKKHLKPGASVLEVGCGHGRALLPLARDGWRLTGLDSSLPMIEAAKQGACTANLSSLIQAVHTDFLAYQPESSHDALVAAMGTIQLLEASTKKFSVWVKKVLKPGSLFLFDLDVGFQGAPDSLWREGPQLEWTKAGWILKIRGRSFRDPKNRRERFELVYELFGAHRLQKTETQSYTIQYYSKKEIVEWVRALGFEVLDLWSDYRKPGLDPTADRWAIQCRLK